MAATAAHAGRAPTQRGTAPRTRPPRGSGTRAKQALELVRARPGITIPELADAMGINANYLYRVMPTLESEGQVVKRDSGWHPRGASAARPGPSSPHARRAPP